MVKLLPFSIGKPEGPNQCSVLSTGRSTVQIRCIIGYDGGDSVTYVVYAIPKTLSVPVVCGTSKKGKIMSLVSFIIFLLNTFQSLTAFDICVLPIDIMS